MGGSIAVSDHTQVPFLTCTSERGKQNEDTLSVWNRSEKSENAKMHLRRPNSGPKSKRNESRLLDAPDRLNLAKFHTSAHIHACMMGGFASGKVSLH